MYDLSVRLTHTYVGTYSDLDDWESIGTFDIRTQSETVDEDDPCEQTTRTFIIDVSSDSDEETIKKALAASLSSSGCAHEHDCCVCWSSYVDTIEKTDDGWVVTQINSRNY